jgi:hypothetical protein
MRSVFCILNGPYIQAALLACHFFLRDFALTRLENFRRVSNLHDNFRFNTIWHRQSMAALVFCRRLAESDVTVMPSVMCMNWLCWWCSRAAHVVPTPTALASLIDMSDKCKSMLPTTVQGKNQWKTISIEEKLDIMSQLEKAEWIVDIWRNVRLIYSSVCTIHDNADRITESAKWGTKVFV